MKKSPPKNKLYCIKIKNEVFFLNKSEREQLLWDLLGFSEFIKVGK